MSISRRVARPMLASIFIVGGLDAVRNPDSKVKSAEVVTRPLAEKVPALDQDTRDLVRLNGLVQVGAGLLLATGRFRRLAALVLLGSVIPTTYAGHRFWEEVDEATRTQQLLQLCKNLGLAGGLILAAVDSEGAPSLGWRARRRARRLEAAVVLGRASSRRRARRSALAAGGRTKEAARHLHQSVDAARESMAGPVLAAGIGLAGDALAQARDHLPAAGDALAQARDLLPAAGDALAQARDLLPAAGDVVAQALDRLPVG